jgi:hypothetical protein
VRQHLALCVCRLLAVAVADARHVARAQVITKLLYLANQGDSFTKVRLLSGVGTAQDCR